jgi:NitT/TauT family transport system substrate-binding protein
MDAFKAGTIDMGYLGAPPALLRVINSGVDIKIISLVNTEGSAIIATNDITTFDQLNNKTIATPGPASIQHLLLLSYANEHGYKVKLAGT